MKITTMFVLVAALVVPACSSGQGAADSITVYSGREEELVADLFDRFTEATGIRVEARYGDSAALAAQILEEGSATPADVFFAQDAGALGALAAEGLLTTLSDELLSRVPDGFRADDASWVGTSGRARTVVYNTDKLDASDLPDSILDFTDERWRGEIGWAPTNASFQASVTALRLLEGEAAARAWLDGIKANRPVEFPKNTPIVEAVAAGEISVGFVNHYYLLRVLAEDPSAPAANHFFDGGDPGALINVAGAGILGASDAQEPAQRFVAFLLEDETQRAFANETFEYPLVAGIEADDRLPPLAELQPPALDLSQLADLEATLKLLADEGIA